MFATLLLYAIILNMTIKRSPKNYAFIDGNNLYLGAKSQNIKLDYRSLRFYLRDKLGVAKALLFIGYDPQNAELYSILQSAGFILVFKPTIPYTENGRRQMKGNVDAELVLHAAAIEYKNYDKAIIISSDGDFACLMRYLKTNKKLGRIITPTESYSSLLRPFGEFILPLKSIKQNISFHKKTKQQSKKPAFAFGSKP